MFKRRRRFFKKSKMPAFLSFLSLIIVLFLIMELFLFVERNLRPAIQSAAGIKADILATEAINKVIMDKVTGGILYRDLIMIEQDNEGKIIMAQLNAIEVNRLMSETTLATQEALVNIEKQPFKIPLGQVLNSYIIATYGPKIPIRLMPMGRVNTRLNDIFEDAGINQVRHKIYLEVVIEMRIIIPFMSTPIQVHTTVPIADTIYPGEVPDTVININFPPEFRTTDYP